ncbi:hypothetical protein ACI2K4_04550 [Micromonospora sp. NPDC050397]
MPSSAGRASGRAAELAKAAVEQSFMAASDKTAPPTEIDEYASANA